MRRATGACRRHGRWALTDRASMMCHTKTHACMLMLDVHGTESHPVRPRRHYVAIGRSSALIELHRPVRRSIDLDASESQQAPSLVMIAVLRARLHSRPHSRSCARLHFQVALPHRRWCPNWLWMPVMLAKVRPEPRIRSAMPTRPIGHKPCADAALLYVRIAGRGACT